MEALRFLKSKEAKAVLARLKEQFGFAGKLDYAWAQNNKGRLFLVTRDVARLPLDELRVNAVGVYVAEDVKGVLRLSIEGSQLIGPEATKNVHEISEEQSREWLRGEDIAYDGDSRDFLIIKNKEDFLGCGKAVVGRILGYVPKNRRVR